MAQAGGPLPGTDGLGWLTDGLETGNTVSVCLSVVCGFGRSPGDASQLMWSVAATAEKDGAVRTAAAAFCLWVTRDFVTQATRESEKNKPFQIRTLYIQYVHLPAGGITLRRGGRGEKTLLFFGCGTTSTPVLLALTLQPC